MRAMRLGTTSYIYPADILTNVGRLAGRVQDVELVIFEVDDSGTDLPDEATSAELRAIASHHGMTYTVHLPLDLRLAGRTPALTKAARVIEKTAGLSPLGFVVHLDGENPTGSDSLEQWLENSLKSLDVLSSEVDAAFRICVENLETYPPEFVDAVLESTQVSCCVDVGHLWKQGLDPLQFLEAWLPRTRIVHLHGVARRDHKSLTVVAPEDLDAVVDILSRRFDGVVTLEVFNERDLLGSLEAFRASLGRVEGKPAQCGRFSEGAHKKPR